jgi:CheY-like chemotaxis protein
MAAATSAQSYLPTQSRVLIASADPLFRKRVLAQAAYSESSCEEAVGGAHALAMLQQMVCDKLDRQLPDLDSAEVAVLIQQRYPGTEVGFVDMQSILTVENPAAAEHQGIAHEMTGDARDESSQEKSRAMHARLFASPEEPLVGMIGSSRAMQKCIG